MGLISDTPGQIDPQTGTYRLDLWTEDATGGAYGDYAVGTAWTARYLSDQEGEGYCAEIALFVEWNENSDQYHVIEMVTVGSARYEDDYWRPADDADTFYELAEPFYYDTLEEAQAVADKWGKTDHSYALMLRRKES